MKVNGPRQLLRYFPLELIELVVHLWLDVVRQVWLSSLLFLLFFCLPLLYS